MTDQTTFSLLELKLKSQQLNLFIMWTINLGLKEMNMNGHYSLIDELFVETEYTYMRTIKQIELRMQNGNQKNLIFEMQMTIRE
jgi:hypothetical protein